MRERRGVAERFVSNKDINIVRLVYMEDLTQDSMTRSISEVKDRARGIFSSVTQNDAFYAEMYWKYRTFLKLRPTLPFFNE